MTGSPPALPLARTPTPLQPMRRLSEAWGCEVWVKRDDLTGFGLSGNKVRKLEVLAAEAQGAGATTLVTCGGLQSNHCRATATVARRLGLDVHLLLRGEEPEIADANVLLDVLLGARLSFCDAETYRHARNDRMDEIAARIAEEGGRAYVIPEGGSNGLGAVAYARAAAEVAEQVSEPFDSVWVAVGSGGTLAGLALGPDIGAVRGVAVCDDRRTFVQRVREIAADAAKWGLGPLPPVGQRWDVLEDYRGPAYAVADPPVWDAIVEVARTEGLFLDPVYTGKALRALKAEVGAGRAGGRVLFWHTGGGFGLFGRGGEVRAHLRR